MEQGTGGKKDNNRAMTHLQMGGGKGEREGKKRKKRNKDERGEFRAGSSRKQSL